MAHDAFGSGPSGKPDEGQLVAGCLRREPAALEQLYVLYARVVLAAADKVVRCWLKRRAPDVAEDLAEDFFVKLIQDPQPILGGFELQRGRLGKWLYSAASHECHNMLRSRCPPGARLEPIHCTVDLDTIPDRAIEGPHKADLVDRRLERLSGESQTIVKAHYGFAPFVHPLTVAEIAQWLGWSPAKVNRHLARSLRALRAMAEPPEGEGEQASG